MTQYYLKTSMSDRLNLDRAAWNNGYEDARIHFAEGVHIEGEESIREFATTLAQEYLDWHEEGDITDDPEEYIARFVDSYTVGYMNELKDLKAQAEREE